MTLAMVRVRPTKARDNRNTPQACGPFVIRRALGDSALQMSSIDRSNRRAAASTGIFAPRRSKLQRAQKCCGIQVLSGEEHAIPPRQQASDPTAAAVPEAG